MREDPWAAPGFAIGLKAIPAEAWLEGGEADPAARKDPLFFKDRAQVWAERPGSRVGQAEVLRLVETHLGRAAAAGDLPPLYAAARQVADDLCLMEKREGQWRLTALSLSAGTFFTAGEVIGRSLEELHGPVPGYAERLLKRTMRVFDGLRDGLVLERRNWTLVNDAGLYMPSAGPMRAAIPDIDPADAGRAISARLERQTLRRLPQTGGALFTIRIHVEPLQALAPERLAAFAATWRAMPSEFVAYKRLELYAPLVERFLAEAGA